MSADKSQAAHEPDRDPELPIGDLSAKPVDEKSADATRGGDGTRVSTSEIVITKSTDSTSPKLL